MGTWHVASLFCDFLGQNVLILSLSSQNLRFSEVEIVAKWIMTYLRSLSNMIKIVGNIMSIN